MFLIQISRILDVWAIKQSFTELRGVLHGTAVNFSAKTQMILLSLFARAELKIMIQSPDLTLIRDLHLVKT